MIMMLLITTKIKRYFDIWALWYVLAEKICLHSSSERFLQSSYHQGSLSLQLISKFSVEKNCAILICSRGQKWICQRDKLGFPNATCLSFPLKQNKYFLLFAQNFTHASCSWSAIWHFDFFLRDLFRSSFDLTYNVISYLPKTLQNGPYYTLHLLGRAA